jgi:NAD(P)H-flavin reductase
MNQMETDESWAVTEFTEADLNDERRRQQLVEITTVLAQQPGASRAEACGHRAMLKATYGFFDHRAVEPEAILASHAEATLDRLATASRVLAVPDTTERKWTHHAGTQGLGSLSGPEQQGLLVHTRLAIEAEQSGGGHRSESAVS